MYGARTCDSFDQRKRYAENPRRSKKKKKSAYYNNYLSSLKSLCDWTSFLVPSLRVNVSVRAGARGWKIEQIRPKASLNKANRREVVFIFSVEKAIHENSEWSGGYTGTSRLSKRVLLNSNQLRTAVEANSRMFGNLLDWIDTRCTGRFREAFHGARALCIHGDIL